MKNTLCCFVAVLLLASCASTKNRKIRKEIGRELNDRLLDNQFTGFLVMDATTKDTIFCKNHLKYFTPASNTKIFTLYTSLQVLPEKVPALKYLVQGDTLFIQGTGDPTLLHPHFQDSTAIDFLKNYEHIALYLNNFNTAKFGAGWAWDDYPYYYQVERSGFPLYGNVVTVFGKDSIQAIPAYFKNNIVAMEYPINREADRNLFYYAADRTDTLTVPFRVDSSLTRVLLETVLKKKVQIINEFPEGDKELLFSVISDSVNKRMMVESDNFLAEQLLILAASSLSDTLDGFRAQEYILENQLSDLQHPPRWVDGSGLSRYNLFTPQSMVHVLQKLFDELPRDRLFTLFPAGGVSGTLEDWYTGDDQPYIYAKSGSLGNNYCLSGYLITHTGKTLIFSFMNNHFLRPSSEIKKRMEAILELLRDTY
ncbi:D-alanyl-D-alanine carboxypeptidase [Flavobacteriaceae bacterium TP-CH-4]|uniref:D-alanyl-D-alanine carboxypeptidase n=1 Tax=Pelagihabitans pacificus TaxID=2696054 RepID=A0A967E6D1_9FLAO|nr:D-alanyl-D-alanine carboxypeptidase [Pelagihabitans pacificus]NHF59490.1 D-alanyl-D-alanine carboxypeptidase [Pelagihabitans pacificus]